jgi:hypothetical protein
MAMSAFTFKGTPLPGSMQQNLHVCRGPRSLRHRERSQSSAIGFLVFLLSAAMGAWTLFTDQALPGWTSTLLRSTSA